MPKLIILIFLLNKLSYSRFFLKYSIPNLFVVIFLNSVLSDKLKFKSEAKLWFVVVSRVLKLLLTNQPLDFNLLAKSYILSSLNLVYKSAGE